MSKFYKSNSTFKPSLLLEKDSKSSNSIWEAIDQIEPEPPAPLPQEPDQTEQPIKQDIDPSELKNEDIPQTEQNNPVIENTQPSPPVALSSEPVQDPVYNIDEIREESFNAGLSLGRKQAEEDFDNGAQTFLNICNELDQLRETILKNSVDEMRELVLAIAEKIIRDSVQEQCDTITATIKEAIHLAVKSEEFQIQLNPEDLSCIEEKKHEIISQIRGLKNIVLLPDNTIERGGCLIESSSCTVDASLASQINVIRDSVMHSSPLNPGTSSKSTKPPESEP